MKIYCTREDRENLDYYVGKDIWVRARCGSIFYSDYYIKIFYKDADGYHYNRINAETKYWEDTSRLINTVNSKSPKCISIHNPIVYLYRPIEALTTEELIDLLKSDARPREL